MKSRILFSAVLIFLFTISFVPGNSESVSKSPGYFQKEITGLNQNEENYTYVRVNKDGVWWIYVYDGAILIASYPEE